MLRYIFGFDAIEDVKNDLLKARAAKLSGRVTEWTTNNLSVKRAIANGDLDEVIRAAELFLRTYDPDIRSQNPIVRRTKPVLFI